MTFDIRLATPEDAPALARVHIASWQSAYRGIVHDSYLDHMDLEKMTLRFANIVDSEIFIREVLCCDGEPIGHVSYGAERQLHLPEYSGELMAIYLLPQWQRQGLGSRLFARAVEGLKTQGYKGMLIWVLADNVSARRFYEAKGGTLLEDSARDLQIDGQMYCEVAYAYKL